MSHLIENDFSSYELSEEEAIQGSLLTITQKQVIQNDIAVTAQEKINLVYDPNNPTLFALQEAKLAGQMGALRYRLECSASTEAELEYKDENSDDLDDPDGLSLKDIFGE